MSDIEPAPGVVIACDENDPGVYISDEQGEVVCWVYDEIVEDPEAWTASLHAVALAASKGPAAVRAFLKHAQGPRSELASCEVCDKPFPYDGEDVLLCPEHAPSLDIS
jgi:hypothetical protein